MTATNPTRPKRKLGHWLVLALLVLAIGAAVIAVVRRNRAPDVQRTLVERVATGTFTREVSGTGTVEADTTRQLSFKTAGTVAEMLVQEGDEVTAGTVLARLDVAALERDLASNRSSLASARADLNRIEAQQRVDSLDLQSAVASAEDARASAEEALNDANNALATTEQLFARGAASQNELNRAQDAAASAARQLTQARLSLETAQTRVASSGDLTEAQLASSEAQIAQLETTIANLEERLAEGNLLAPFTGTVTDIGFKVGDQVAQANFINLVDTSQLYIKANFDENRATELTAGQAAIITPDADARQKLAATLRRVGKVANRTSSAAQLEADLEFDDASVSASGLVRPGYTVTTKVIVNQLEDVLLVPLEAITEVDGSSYVYKITQDEEAGMGTAVRADLEILDRNATLAAATSSSLTAGDLIALINLEDLEDGSAVTFDPLGDGA